MHIKNREEYYEQQGLTGEPAAPQRPALPGARDLQIANAWNWNLETIATLPDPPDAKEVATRLLAFLQAEAAYLNGITANEKAEWRERYKHLGPQFEAAIDARFGALMSAEPTRFVDTERNYNVPEMKKAYFEASEEQAKALGSGPADTVEDVIAEREKKAVATRGYGYGRDSLSNSMNLGTQH